jgi:hypothetical protein
MPKINGREFSYSPAGKAAAAAYQKVVNKNKDDNQKTITAKEVLKDVPQPQMGESQGEFVKGQLGALDEGDRGMLNPTNTKIARQILVEFYRKWRASQISAARGKKVK